MSPIHHDHVTGPFFHGTAAALGPGEELVPGYGSNFQVGRVLHHIYFTGLLATAAWGAELATALTGKQGRGHVYLVEPQGAFEDDPNVTDEKMPGNPTQSYRTHAPLRIIDEITDWPSHDCEVIAGMLSSLQQLRERGHDVILD